MIKERRASTGQCPEATLQVRAGMVNRSSRQRMAARVMLCSWHRPSCTSHPKTAGQQAIQACFGQFGPPRQEFYSWRAAKAS